MRTKEEILDKHWSKGESIKKAALKAMEEYKLEILYDIKLGFDICSDTSAFCLGYRNLVERIRREEKNQPIDKSISPINRLKKQK
jgi:hypothetical protein